MDYSEGDCLDLFFFGEKIGENLLIIEWGLENNDILGEVHIRKLYRVSYSQIFQHMRVGIIFLKILT